jgi:hypothetical protein
MKECIQNLKGRGYVGDSSVAGTIKIDPKDME